MATEEARATQKPEDAVVELPAPADWKKTYNRGKSGTPKRYQIIFTSPSGEEIRSKNQLDKYLKSHPGGPAASEFDWSTGETPRRSSRISSKAKAMESPEDEPPTKRSSSKKTVRAEADKTDDEDKDAEEKKVSEAVEEIKAREDAKMQDVENVMQIEKGDISSGEPMVGNVPMSEEKVEVKSDIPGKNESTPEREQESILADRPVSEEKIEVNIETREQHGEALEESTLQVEQKSTLAGDGPIPEENVEVNTEIREQPRVAFQEVTLQVEQKSTRAGDGLIPEENVEVNTEILEQHRDAFEESTLEKEQISISSFEVPKTNESKEAGEKPKGPEDFQEAKTSPEANETMQVAKESVKGAQDHPAGSKA